MQRRDEWLRVIRLFPIPSIRLRILQSLRILQKTVTEIAKRLLWETLIAPQCQQGAYGGRYIFDVYGRSVEGVHACIGPIATDVDIVNIFGASDDTDVTHKGTCTAIRTASHTYTQWIACQ